MKRSFTFFRNTSAPIPGVGSDESYAIKIKPGTEFKNISKITLKARSTTNTSAMALEWQNIKLNDTLTNNLNDPPGTCTINSKLTEKNRLIMTKVFLGVAVPTEIQIVSNDDEITLTVDMIDVDEFFYLVVELEGEGGEDLTPVSDPFLPPDTVKGLAGYERLQ